MLSACLRNARKAIEFAGDSLKGDLPTENGEVLKVGGLKKWGVFLVRRRRDKLWMFPGGRKRGRETEKQCLLREINEEYVRLPDDCDPLPGGFVTIRRTISIDCTSFVCKYPSAAATRSATRSKNEMGIVRPVAERHPRSRLRCLDLRFLVRDCQRLQ